MINCRFENGNEALLRHVVMDAVCVKDQRILMVKRADHLIEGGKFALPGGYLDRDETLEDGVLRELKEETGYDGKIIKLLKVVDKIDRGDDRQNICFLYQVEPLGQTGQSDGETEGIYWFDLAELPSVDQVAFDHRELIDIYLGMNPSN